MDDESVNMFDLGAPSTDTRRASTHPNKEVEEPAKPTSRKNKVFDLIKREIDARTKRPAVYQTGLFVDKSRNAAITGGDRDLIADVKSKQRRDRLKGQADAADEGDYLTFLTQVGEMVICKVKVEVRDPPNKPDTWDRSHLPHPGTV